MTKDILNECSREFGDSCFFCETKESEIPHFIDGDRTNTSMENVRPACSECYSKIHAPSHELVEWSSKLKNSPVSKPSESEVKDIIEDLEYPSSTFSTLLNNLDCSRAILEEFLRESDFSLRDVSGDDYIVYSETTDQSDETVMLFPDRREIVGRDLQDETRRVLSGVSHMEDMNGNDVVYGVDKEDVWNSSFDNFEGYVESLEDVAGEVTPRLRSRLESDWNRANMFRMETEDSDTVLVAEDNEVFENVAKRKLEHYEHYTSFIDDTSLRITNGAEAKVKQKMYEEGYPVKDRRELELGANLDVSLKSNINLRDYQENWKSTFIERGSGTFVGPSGSGKTVATLGVMSNLDSETLVIVTKRELARQWKQEITEKTSVPSSKVGEYHGGKKQVRPITIATYDTAKKSRHRELFNEREWGLLVLDEAHHATAPTWSRVANLQSRYRLGLTATPVRESGNSEEIYSLIGPPVGTDWHKLFEDGYVQKPSVQIETVSWGTESQREHYKRADGHSKRQVAAMNSRKVSRVKEILSSNEDKNTIIFVEWIKQGRKYEDELGIPFICGETSHKQREKYFNQMKNDEMGSLIISRVGDEGIDIPNAELCVICSTLGSSSSQTAQRIGRTMRPTGASRGILIATKGSNEEDFVQSSTEFLAQQGIEVSLD